MADWNKRFIDLARHISTWSKDRSVGAGAVIVDEDNRIVSIGYNGFPSGADDTKEERHERPLKYFYTEHAERNAIFNAARIGSSTKGCIMYIVWPSCKFPCARCARAIIQSGIKKIVCYRPVYDDERWGDELKVSKEMLDECGVKIEFLD